MNCFAAVVSAAMRLHGDCHTLAIFVQVQGGLQHKVCGSLRCVRHYILNWLRIRQNIAEEMIPLGRYANLDLGLDLERIVRLWAPLAEVEAAAAAAEAEAALAEDP
jgi:hypothetical protein